ncbi:MAG: IS66 family transposase [Ardenticatenaceae bacterium]|nr:IS66 family transposase [Ardenticatenaceae bacterium]
MEPLREPNTELTAEQMPAVIAENEVLRAELAAAREQIAELQYALQAALATVAALRAEVASAQARINELDESREQLDRELTAIKQAPYQARRRRVARTAAPRERKKPGRKAGHPGSGRARPSRIDRVEVISAGERCPDCGRAFTGEGVVRERIVEEIEPVRPTVVTCFQIERRWCPTCRKYHESPVTAALPRHRLGLRVLLFVVYQKVALGLSYGKIRQELATYFGLRLSLGELPGMVAEVAQLFGPAYARLIELMRRQAAIHIDETSWRIDGHGHWLWVFVNDLVALYVISRSRGSKVPKALLGPDFEGVAITDFFSAYSPLEINKAKCWAHLLRDSHDFASGRPPDSERAQFHRRLQTLFLEMGLALEEVAADPDARLRLTEAMRTRLLAFATEPWQTWDCRNLAERIRKYLDDLLVWLSHPAVPPTNNAAERALRPAVVTRKTSFGSRSRQGAFAFVRLLSLIETWERQGKDFYSTAFTALVDSCSQN